MRRVQGYGALVMCLRVCAHLIDTHVIDILLSLCFSGGYTTASDGAQTYVDSSVGGSDGGVDSMESESNNSGDTGASESYRSRDKGATWHTHFYPPFLRPLCVSINADAVQNVLFDATLWQAAPVRAQICRRCKIVSV
jgi:hypothetical protein